MQAPENGCQPPVTYRPRRPQGTNKKRASLNLMKNKAPGADLRGLLVKHPLTGDRIRKAGCLHGVCSPCGLRPFFPSQDAAAKMQGMALYPCRGEVEKSRAGRPGGKLDFIGSGVKGTM